MCFEQVSTTLKPFEGDEMQIVIDLTSILLRLDEIEAKIESLSSARAGKDLLSAGEAAPMLDIGLSQLYRLTSERRIQYYKPADGRIYFKRSDLETYVLTGNVSTQDEISRLADQLVQKRAYRGKRQ